MIHYQEVFENNMKWVASKQQCINILKIATIQRQYNADKLPTVHGWVYDLHNGLLKDLGLDMEAEMRKIRRIYDLQAG